MYLRRSRLSWQPIIRRRAVGQAPVRFVDRAEKIQAVRGEGRCRSIAVSRGQNGFDPVRRLMTLADAHQAAHDVADHVVEKSVSFEFEAPVGTAAGNADPPHGLDR